MSLNVVDADTSAWLDNTQGLISPNEGRLLARLAAFVPANQAIVELGTHTGLSTCWMAAGSRVGYGAHIIAVDPWPEPRPPSPDYDDDPWKLGAEGVLDRFRSNVAGTTQDVPREDYGDLITALRTTSLEAERTFVKPVGLLFVDAIHEEAAVRADHAAWAPHVVAGGWIAFHDFGGDYPGCTRAITDIEATGSWIGTELVDGLWAGQVAP